MAQQKSLEAIFRERLGSMIARGGANGRLSANALASRCKLTSSRRVTDWLDGTVMPSADNLRRLAEALGVSVDWLLGFDVPKMRGSSRDRIDLEEELAIVLEGEIAIRVQGQPYAFQLSTKTIDGAEVIRSSVASILTSIEEAWNQANAYAASGADLLTHVASKNSHRAQRQSRLVARIAFRDAIFLQQLAERIRLLCTIGQRSPRQGHRPLAELAKSAAPIRTRR
jgi:transcriptional regulator with XRE-family HTH domain